MTRVEDGRAFVLLLTGPAGAGQSAAARAWAALQPGIVAHIELDSVRDQIIKGFADPRDGWKDEADWQYTIARQNCADMARRYVREGVTCLIDDAIFPAWDRVNMEGWRTALGDIPHRLIALLPHFEAVSARNAQRTGSRLLAPDMLRTIYDMMEPWRDQSSVPVIDTTSLSIEETAQAIQRTLDRLPPPRE
ncbi:MAG TPA: AAA family ATPase [Ktedonobacterales bacterium]